MRPARHLSASSMRSERELDAICAPSRCDLRKLDAICAPSQCDRDAYPSRAHDPSRFFARDLASTAGAALEFGPRRIYAEHKSSIPFHASVLENVRTLSHRTLDFGRSRARSRQIARPQPSPARSRQIAREVSADRVRGLCRPHARSGQIAREVLADRA
eukprot:4732152-Pleurochrysis_carterae.AAC.1